MPLIARFPRVLSVLLLAGGMLALAGCATRMGADGQTETVVAPRYLLKTDMDRVADASRQEVVEGLLKLADKLYRRNPGEWRKTGVTDRDGALSRLRHRLQADWRELGGARERLAAGKAFDPAFGGDRVAALVFGLLNMVDTAYEYKDEFFFFDRLDEVKLFNTARNLEIAVWKLSHDRQPSGQLFLLSNELDPANRNLSFEREFGRLIGLLDFMARVVADRNGRSLSRLSQSVATAVFLPVGF